jgi:hypothetical protein
VWHHYACDSGSCIEVAKSDEMILIRDSKDPDGPVLRFSQDEWNAFVLGVRQGDLPLA